jgi:hypothetical protein
VFNFYVVIEGGVTTSYSASVRTWERTKLYFDLLDVPILNRYIILFYRSK